MEKIHLIKEIHNLREELYKLGDELNVYSKDEILEISEELDQRIIEYQKILNKYSMNPDI